MSRVSKLTSEVAPTVSRRSSVNRSSYIGEIPNATNGYRRSNPGHAPIALRTNIAGLADRKQTLVWLSDLQLVYNHYRCLCELLLAMNSEKYT